jgi:adenosylcobinamide-phosphate synthase
MNLECQILIAVALDLIIGDPRWFPHPVKLMGKLAMTLEPRCRAIIQGPRVAGVVTACTVIVTTVVCAAGLVISFRFIHPVAGDLMSIFLIYSGIAARDMVDHSSKVYEALKEGALQEARSCVAMICGRDTDQLDDAGIVRATIESVAENAADGAISPLFYAVIGGPIAIMAYKAVNTLDSTFGYKNPKYLEFGWFSARLDDLANFIPARLTGILIPVAALILNLDAVQSYKIFARDRLRHPSPNAGQAEAAMAGALGIQLGGLSYYGGEPSNKPTLGAPLTVPKPERIRDANRLLLVTSGLALALFLGIRFALTHEFGL